MNLSRTTLKTACVACLISFSLTAPSFGADAKAITSVTVQPLETGKDVILTFAHPFKKGDIPDTLALRAGTEKIPAQVDIKRRYADGSVKHAIISTVIDSMTAGKPLAFSIHADKADMLHLFGNYDGAYHISPVTLPSTEVTFTFPDGNKSTARFRLEDLLRKTGNADERFRRLG